MILIDKENKKNYLMSKNDNGFPVLKIAMVIKKIFLTNSRSQNIL